MNPPILTFLSLDFNPEGQKIQMQEVGVIFLARDNENWKIQEKQKVLSRLRDFKEVSIMAFWRNFDILVYQIEVHGGNTQLIYKVEN